MNRDGMADSLKSVTIQQYKTDIGFRTLVESVDENLYTRSGFPALLHSASISTR